MGHFVLCFWSLEKLMGRSVDDTRDVIVERNTVLLQGRDVSRGADLVWTATGGGPRNTE